jgi:hypothetical protein
MAWFRVCGRLIVCVVAQSDVRACLRSLLWQAMGMEVTMHPGKGPVFTKVRTAL